MRKNKNSKNPGEEIAPDKINDSPKNAAWTDAYLKNLANLTLDRRSPAIRMLTAASASLAFVFTFMFFGPCELYVGSVQFMTFPFSTLALNMGLISFAVFALMFAILCLLRGKIYNYAVSAIFTVTVAGYIQRNFLNLDHGALDGHSVNWAAVAEPAMWDLLFWLAVAAAVLLLLYFSRKWWTYTVRALSLVLVGAQTVALVVMLATASFPHRVDSEIVSDEGIYNVTTGDNVIFLLLDNFDNVYADELLEKHPEWEEKLGGFTYYRNFTGSYFRTMPSVTYLLTGKACSYDIPYDDYFKEAWKSPEMLTDIKNSGYKVRIYTDEQYVFGDPKNLRGIADNYIPIKRKTDYGLMFRDMMKLSVYVYAPEVVKPFFLMYTGDLAAISTTENKDIRVYTVDDHIFFGNLKKRGLTVEDAKGTFTFCHLTGSHVPYTMNEKGERVDSSDVISQTAGVFVHLFEYFDMLREKGMFDNTTIIISSDHGRQGNIRELDGTRCPSLFIKPAGADCKVPMRTSMKQVCQDNLRASIASYFGVWKESSGRTIESIGEDEDVTRRYYMSAVTEDGKIRDGELVTYEIKGDATDLSNWHEVERKPIKYPFYDG